MLLNDWIECHASGKKKKKPTPLLGYGKNTNGLFTSSVDSILKHSIKKQKKEV
jgi:hypothetical protein